MRENQRFRSVCCLELVVALLYVGGAVNTVVSISDENIRRLPASCSVGANWPTVVSISDENIRRFVNSQICQNSDPGFAMLTLIPNGIEDPLNRFVHLTYSNDGQNVPIRGASMNNLRQCNPPSGSKAINYMITRSAAGGAATGVRTLLDALPQMWINFHGYYGEHPNAIILLSRLVPCGDDSDCRQHIADTFNSAPYKDVPDQIVAYVQTVPERHRNNFVNFTHNIRPNNVRVFELDCRQPLSIPGRSIPHIGSFQKCLLDCTISTNIGCCVSRPAEGRQTFVDQIMTVVSGVLNQHSSAMINKANNWIDSHIGKHCYCHESRGRNHVRDWTSSCLTRCRSQSRLFYDQPIQQLTSQISQGSCLTSVFFRLDRGSAYSCNNGYWRRSGLLCTNYDRSSLTAGTSPINSYSCSFNGQAYYWAYTHSSATSESWDYCCLDGCRSDGRCWVGNTYVRCGSSGYHTVQGEICMHNHPCGLHGKSYYWCYTKIDGSWDYCCAPESPCSNNECHVKPDQNKKLKCK